MSLPGLMEAFWEYERALMSNDLVALDRLFAAGPETIRGDASGLLVGHHAISAFRSGRGGAPPRRIVRTEVREIDPTHALIVAVTEADAGGRGQQTQLWERQAAGWVVTAAHVAVAAPALDRRIWRVIGDPLVPAIGSGPLTGQSIAAKDLYAVAGHRVGAGNPAWLEQAEIEPEHAWAVRRLLEDGASGRGIAATDEFAYSLAGTNAHYGAPPNPKAPYRISGGSSSGSASAVSLGHATIGLGTDTGGSIRVPAAYQGLWGIRTTHGAISTDGLLPLSPTFDTVGWLTRDVGLLGSVAAALLPPDSSVPGELVTVAALNALAEQPVHQALAPLVASVPEVAWDLPDTADLLAHFQALQAYEAWQVHGPWLAGRLDVLGTDVRSRFERASQVTEAQAVQAREAVTGARHAIRAWLGDRVLLLPSASSSAPPLDDPSVLDRVRHATMQLTCIAGLGGLPGVNVPLVAPDGLPVGACLVGPAGSDQALIALAARFNTGETPVPS